ncbi:UNVERIFIED_CONTAM: hypothetical protein FKN15_076040 [Acipenser sinensis]
MEAHLKKAYAAEAQVTRLANTARLLMVYLDGILQSATLHEPVASELSLVSVMLLQISGFKGKALGRNLAGLIVANIRASSGSDPATVPPRMGGILTDGLDAPFPCSIWHPPVTWMVTWTVTRTFLIPTALRSNLRHHLQASVAANNRGRPHGQGNAGSRAPAQQRSGRQF